MKKLIKILLITAVTFIVAGSLCYWGVRLYAHINEERLHKDYGTLEQYFDSPIRWISVSAEAADIRIIRSDRTGCRIENAYLPNCEIYSESGRMHVVEKNPDTAVISGWHIGNSLDYREKAIIDIYLYEPDYENFDLEVGAGNINIDELNVANMVMQIGAGSVSAKSLSITSNAAAQISVGNVEVDMLDAERFKAEIGSGSVRAGLLDSCDEYDIDILATMGRVKIAGKEQILVNQKASYGDSSSPWKIILDCAAGDVELWDASDR